MITELFDNAKMVYNLLQDNESRDIFLNRILYNITQDINYINIITGSIIDKKDEIISNEMKGKLKQIVDENKKLVIYGAGTFAPRLFDLIGEYVYCFCDMDETKQKSNIRGKSIISPEELITNKEEYVVIISVLDFYDEVSEFLNNNGVEILPFRYAMEIQDLHKNQYFDKELIKFTDDEVFIDAGCFNFGTSKNLLNRCSSVKKIYAFEPNYNQYLRCKMHSGDISTVAIYPYGLWDDNTELCFDSTLGSSSRCITDKGKEDETVIKAVKLDDILNGEKATFIKMDIEGAELKALIGAEKTISKYKPKLAICVYHKKQDIIDIPLYINSIVPDYKLYMRHYSKSTNETVLYAI